MEVAFLELLEGRFSRKARKQVFQFSEGLAASIHTEQFCPSGGGFPEQITLD